MKLIKMYQRRREVRQFVYGDFETDLCRLRIISCNKDFGTNLLDGFVKVKPFKLEASPISSDFYENKGGPGHEENTLDSLYLCGLFKSDTYDRLKKLETEQTIDRDFLNIQTEVTRVTRAILIDWLTQIHLKLQLLLETLYLTVDIVNRVLQSERILKSELQLVGVTAMFLASKYEEMCSPDVNDFERIVSGIYTITHILKMEDRIITTLDYKLERPLPIHFLGRISRAAVCDPIVHTLAKYLMELTLVQPDFVCIPPSLLGAATLYLSMKIIDKNSWSKQMASYSGYTETQIYPVAQALSEVLVKASSQKQKAVYVKYASVRLWQVSVLPEFKSEYVFRMASILEEIGT